MVSIADILHRTVVIGCVGVSIWGIGTGFAVHTHTMKRGQEIMDERKALGLTDEPVDKKTKQEEQSEARWAEEAQAVLKARGASNLHPSTVDGSAGRP
ncbi:uncharacterized protein STEHIDRAFT_105712 [Stereum hirsutum FP-91666 SS1]|uniref:Uncharacterized protein n=1 Tax=Stereum hirsutum (strain FP-91666) TaxID=721885 RepID=R7RYW6_STEHR|nr:uncharacterized protein STEHIDRAFT_105712 [Stereum hirsutum FP-91666 SS1]EIM80095.1 hypothetical protein STEHIDRAFT_105712 [Stereum hirsutum FP-91666 SS1]